MKHLIICPEFPPAPVPAGGIGTYVRHISRLLAEAGETVHVIGQRWQDASQKIEKRVDGRLIIHRISPGEPVIGIGNYIDPSIALKEVQGLIRSDFQRQCFSWQASLLAEILVDRERIDLIEAQDYDAPLYYFLLRRALGQGPKRLPPCIVHLHSATAFINYHNDWDSWNPEHALAIRFENFSVSAADAWLCPSNYYARQAEAHFGLEKESVTVIPLPVGDFSILDRSEEIWRSGTICYVGRLEPRKGVIEWVDAASAVARDYPSVQFEMIGADLPYMGNSSVKQFLKKRIPDAVMAQFHFHGPCRRAELPQFLARARAAVVPSRWENFPNTCIEAMCSGLPVIATCKGGMSDMIEDGQTGWLVEDCSKSSLEIALRHMLNTKPSDVAEMGWLASERIRRLCDNGEILSRHLHFRRSIAERSVSRSIYLPAILRWKDRPDKFRTEVCVSNPAPASSVAVVVTCRGNGDGLENCLDSIRQQTRPPFAAVLIVDNKNGEKIRHAVERARLNRLELCELDSGKLSMMKNAALSAVIASGRNPAAFTFLDSRDRLYPNFLEICGSVIKSCPDVGVVSSWMWIAGDAPRLVANPCPQFPYQLISNEALPAAVIRTTALNEAGHFRELISDGYEDWDLINAIMANGWLAVTFPALLTERIFDRQTELSSSPEHRRMREQLLDRLPELVEHYAQTLVLMLESRISQLKSPGWQGWGITKIDWYERILRPRDILHLTLPEQFMLTSKAIRHPGQAARFFLWHTKKAFLDRSFKRSPGRKWM
jgi:glycogen(starch) synthase